jgi:hypothetical protein
MVVSEKKNSVGFASRGSEMTVKGHGYHDKEPRRAKHTKNNVESAIIIVLVTYIKWVYE